MILNVFGDSLSADETYLAGPDQSWVQQIQQGPFASVLGHNHTRGGALSGKATHWGYKMDGIVLESKGVLGQIDAATIEAGSTNVVWVGTNDLILACHLDPFTTVGGMTVTATSAVTEFRDGYLATHSPLQYAHWIIDNYLMDNLGAAVIKIRSRGCEVVLVNYFRLQDTRVAASNAPLVRAAVDYANAALRTLCKDLGVYMADVSGITVTTVDEVHLDHAAQKQVLAGIRAAAVPK